MQEPEAKPGQGAGEARAGQGASQAGQAMSGQPMGEAANNAQVPGTAALAATDGAALERDLIAALAKANENYDLFLRARAEADNTRRRAQDDIAKAHKYAIESFAEALVPVMDSLEKALAASAAAGPATDAAGDPLREGLQITLRQLQAAFEKNRLLPIDPVGEKFDPHRHQAIATVAAEGVRPNHVVAVLQKGWTIADRVLQPALVTVAQADAGENKAGQNKSSENKSSENKAGENK